MFNYRYFIQGPYLKSRRQGWIKYFNQFFWARRYYANLIKKYIKEGSLLEIGCGLGDQKTFLGDKFDYLGTDISEEAIRIAREKIKAKFKVLKAEEINKFEKNKFDIVLANYVLEHLKNPEIVIKYCYDITKPGGFVFIAVPNLSSLMRKIKKGKWVGFRDKTHVSLYAPKVWEEIFQKNKFKVVEKFADGFWDVPYIKFIPAFLQLLIFDFLGILQTIFTLKFLPTSMGEGLIIIVQKPE